MISYMNTASQVTLDLLKTFSQTTEWNHPLWISVMDALRVTFEVDEDMFWTTETYKQYIPVLVAQVESLGKQPGDIDDLTKAFAGMSSALVDSTTSEVILKQFNAALLLTTRSENAQVRLVALQVLDAIWAKQEEMVQFVPETVGEFLNELLEDEEASVEQAARRFLKRIEGYVGDLSAYLE